MDSKFTKSSSPHSTPGTKPCIVRITRLTRPIWLSRALSLPASAQIKTYEDTLADIFTPSKSAIIITSPIELPKAIFGKNTELPPIKCTITHINFIGNNLKLVLHKSTKAGLLTAYNHFLGTWPMRYASAEMKDILRGNFIRDVGKVKWKVGCEVLKCTDQYGCGNLLDLYEKIAIDFQEDKGKGRRRMRTSKSLPPAVEIPKGLEILLEGAVETIKNLFAPGLPASVPVNIWGIPWKVMKVNVQRFVQDGEGDSNEEVEAEEEEVLETAAPAPCKPVISPSNPSQFKLRIKFFETRYPDLFINLRRRWEIIHDVTASNLAVNPNGGKPLTSSGSLTQHGTKRSLEHSDPSSSDTESPTKRLNLGKPANIPNPYAPHSMQRKLKVSHLSSCEASPLEEELTLDAPAATPGSSPPPTIKRKRGSSDSSFSDVPLPKKRSQSHRSANISETLWGGKIRLSSTPDLLKEAKTEKLGCEIIDLTQSGDEGSEDTEGQERMPIRLPREVTDSPQINLAQEQSDEDYYDSEDSGCSEPRLPTPPWSPRASSTEYDDEETETDYESDESEAEIVHPCRCNGGKFKSGYHESAAAREWYYV